MYTASKSFPDPDVSSPDASPLPPSPSPGNIYSTFTMCMYNTSCQYPSSSKKKLSRFTLSISVRSFISSHQVAAAGALLLLLLLLRTRFTVVRPMALTWIFCYEFYYTACTDKWPWPWPKHSLGQHESLCQVWSRSAQPFGRDHRQQTDKQINKHIAFYMLDYITGILYITN